jgi:hypothetical protein
VLFNPEALDNAVVLGEPRLLIGQRADHENNCQKVAVIEILRCGFCDG